MLNKISITKKQVFKLIPLFLLILSIFVIFFNLGKRELSESTVQNNEKYKTIMHYNWKDVHEKRYAGISNEIAESGDWFTLKWEERSYYNKGPVHYWLTALSIKKIGYVNLAPRIWPAFFSLGTVIIVYLLSRRLFNKKVALWAVIILITSIHFIIASREGTLDASTTFFIIASMYFFIIYQDNKKYLFFFISIMLVAVMGLVKSAFNVIPAILILLMLDFKNFFSTSKLRFILKWLLSLLILVTIVGSWIGIQYYQYPEYERDNITFKKIFFDAQLNKSFTNTATTHEIIKYSGGKKYGRYGAGANYDYDNPFYIAEEVSSYLYYPKNILKGFYPWSIFLILSIAYSVFLVIKHKNKKFLSILIIFLVISTVLFIAFEKRAKWALVLYPFLSIMTARTITDLIDIKNNKILRWGIFLTFILFISILIPFNIEISIINVIFYLLLFALLSLYLFSNNLRLKKVSIFLLIAYFIVIGLLGALYPVLINRLVA